MWLMLLSSWTMGIISQYLLLTQYWGYGKRILTKYLKLFETVQDNCRQWDIQEDSNARPGHQLKKNLLWQNCVSLLFIITSAQAAVARLVDIN